MLAGINRLVGREIFVVYAVRYTLRSSTYHLKATKTDYFGEN